MDQIIPPVDEPDRLILCGDAVVPASPELNILTKAVERLMDIQGTININHTWIKDVLMPMVNQALTNQIVTFQALSLILDNKLTTEKLQNQYGVISNCIASVQQLQNAAKGEAK
jgi:hypothetical protein